MEFDLAGHVRLLASLEDEHLRRAVAAEMDPYRPVAAGAATRTAEPTLALSLLDSPGALDEVQLMAGDGHVTGAVAGSVFVMAGAQRARVPDAVAEEPALVAFDAGFPLRRLFRQVVRPGLHLRALAGGGVACHAAAVVRDGSAVLIGGWSESGKTETALALAEDGAQFLTDKWTLLAPGMDGEAAPTAAPFPIGVGVRGWALSYLPTLRRSMPARARVRLAVAGAAGAASAPVRRGRRRGLLGMAGDGVERVVAVAGRVGLTVTEIAAAYGHDPIRDRVPVRLVAVLRTVPGTRVTAEPGDPTRLARRLAAAAVTERQAYLALRQRAAFAEASPPDGRDVAALEAERLQTILEEVQCVEVSAPFPADPRTIVEALDPWISGPR